MKKGSKRTLATAVICLLLAIAASSIYFVMRNRDAASERANAEWNSITSVRIDFRALVTNRVIAVGSAADAVKAHLQLREMYFHEGDFVLPFTGHVTWPKGAFDCSLQIRAPVRFEQGRVFAGEFRLGLFRPHDHALGADEKFVAATLFGMVKDRIEIQTLEVDRAFKAVHSIYNDFIEFEK